MENKYSNTHDLFISDWGPFSKKYFGVSHIADIKKGLRFDFSVMPGYYRAKLIIPDVLAESGVHPFSATADYSFYSYRYELEWKDQLYADVSYFDYDNNTKVVRCEYVNNTDNNQNTTLNYVANLNPPTVSVGNQETMVYAYPILPEDGVYIDALSYDELTFKTPRPQDNLNFAGLFKGEERVSRFINGSALGKGFGDEVGDRVSYSFNLSAPMKKAYLIIRYKADHANVLRYQGAEQVNLVLPKTDKISYVKFEIGRLKEGENTFSLVANGPGGLKLDGYVITEIPKNTGFFCEEWDLEPSLFEYKNGVDIKYKYLDHSYGLKWIEDNYLVREYKVDYLEPILKKTVAGLSNKKYDEGGINHYTNAYIYPIYLKPHESYVTYALISTDTEKLHTLNLNKDDLETLYLEKKSNKIDFNNIKSGEQYKFAIELMTSTIQSNIVFPIYVQGNYIRHNTPGKWWDCLYTWDSGFIGLGMTTYSKERALETLNAYMTEVGNKHAAFIHFGSPVPVQFYMFYEILNKYLNKEDILIFYPSLKQYYEFLSGKLGSSDTNSLNTNLLKTWSYFYNSGGWDDYPPQVEVHKKGLTSSVTAVATTCHVIRCAKILKTIAQNAGIMQDVSTYDKDIEIFKKAVLNNCWDEESGYFSYVVHDENGNKKNILKYNNEINYNMGLDGAYPLVAGICTDHQRKTLIEKIKSDKLFTKIGLSTVDISAPYFKKDGYWNGAVWMAHQWFYFKTMLDQNQGDFAKKIAITALNTWKKECELTYNCYEHFLVESERGAGWHNFSALSAPVVNWFNYYFVKGNLTGGFELFIEDYSFSETFEELKCKVRNNKQENICMLVVLSDEHEYEFYCDEYVMPSKKNFDGSYEIEIEGNFYGTITSKIKGN